MHLGSSHFFCETEDVYLDTRFVGVLLIQVKLRTNSSLIAANKRTAFKFIFIPVLKTGMGVIAKEYSSTPTNS